MSGVSTAGRMIQMSASSAQGVGRPAHGNKAEQNQLGGFQGIADGSRHGRACHRRGVGACIHQKGDVRLLAQGLDDGADEQAGKQPLGHGAHGVDAVAMGGENDILAFAEFLDTCHKNPSCFLHDPTKTEKVERIVSRAFAPLQAPCEKPAVGVQ